jgi:hypothetical protein
MTTSRFVPTLAFALALAACATSPWTELDSLEDLKAAFQRDRGRTRLVLLLSPT